MSKTIGTVTVRPYRSGEFERACQIREITHPEAIEKFHQRFMNSGTWLGHFLHLAIDLDGELVGDIQLRHCDASMPPGAVEMGLEIARELRGRGIGTLALREIAQYAFKAGDHRIEGSTAEDNIGMRKAFENAGWKFEGVLRALFTEDDKPIDYFSFATTRYDESDGSVA